MRKALLTGDRSTYELCAQCDFHGFRKIINPRESYRGPRNPGGTILEKLLTVLNKIELELVTK